MAFILWRWRYAFAHAGLSCACLAVVSISTSWPAESSDWEWLSTLLIHDLALAVYIPSTLGGRFTYIYVGVNTALNVLGKFGISHHLRESVQGTRYEDTAIVITESSGAKGMLVSCGVAFGAIALAQELCGRTCWGAGIRRCWSKLYENCSVKHSRRTYAIHDPTSSDIAVAPHCPSGRGQDSNARLNAQAWAETNNDAANVAESPHSRVIHEQKQPSLTPRYVGKVIDTQITPSQISDPARTGPESKAVSSDADEDESTENTSEKIAAKRTGMSVSTPHVAPEQAHEVHERPSHDVLERPMQRPEEEPDVQTAALKQAHEVHERPSHDVLERPMQRPEEEPDVQTAAPEQAHEVHERPSHDVLERPMQRPEEEPDVANEARRAVENEAESSLLVNPMHQEDASAASEARGISGNGAASALAGGPRAPGVSFNVFHAAQEAAVAQDVSEEGDARDGHEMVAELQDDLELIFTDSESD